MFTYMNKDYENNTYWMGINDIVEEDKFVWADGTDANDDFAKSLWRWKQPNNWQDQDCGVIGYEGSEYMDDLDCEEHYRFVCRND